MYFVPHLVDQWVPLTSCADKITFKGMIVQRLLEKVCLSNGDHHFAVVARGQRELSSKSYFYL